MWKVNKFGFVIVYSAVPLICKDNDEKMNGGIMNLNVVISILMLFHRNYS